MGVGVGVLRTLHTPTQNHTVHKSMSLVGVFIVEPHSLTPDSLTADLDVEYRS